MHKSFKLDACFEHSDFFKVNSPATCRRHSEDHARMTDNKARDEVTPDDGPNGHGTDPTTSFLTAAIILYTLRAGITAAAGTRLALS